MGRWVLGCGSEVKGWVCLGTGAGPATCGFRAVKYEGFPWEWPFHLDGMKQTGENYDKTQWFCLELLGCRHPILVLKSPNPLHPKTPKPLNTKQ